MVSKRKKNKKIIILISIVVILVLCIFYTLSDNRITFGEDLAGTATNPITSMFSSMFEGIGNVFKGSKSQISILTSENEELKKNNAILDDTIAENKRLKELLDYKDANPGYEYIATTIVSRSGSYLFSTFTIGVGKSSGVDTGMPVVSKDGLVGVISEAGATWSKVTSIIDSSSNVSAVIEKTRENGTVKGILDANEREFGLVIEHLPLDTTVTPGDKVVTSGLGGIYPRGIVIGLVNEVEQSSDGSKTVTITPSSNFLSLENVMVVKTTGNKDFLE